MKRNKLLKHLAENNCYLARHGNNHDIYKNSTNLDLWSAVPRHSDIHEILCKKICKELGISKI